MKIIGLVGGVASGKSRVAEMLAERGAGLVDADRAGHAVLAEDRAVQAAMRQQWGDSVFKEDGSVDRAAVARRVFAAGEGGVAERRFLEELTHPRIRERMKSQVQNFSVEGKDVVVLDAALLFEAGWNKLCDLVVFVDAPREIRMERAKKRGWTEAEFDQREAVQMPVEEKRRAATVVVSNDGSMAELREAVERLWKRHIEAGQSTN